VSSFTPAHDDIGGLAPIAPPRRLVLGPGPRSPASSSFHHHRASCLQLARDIAPAGRQALGMFVLRPEGENFGRKRKLGARRDLGRGLPAARCGLRDGRRHGACRGKTLSAIAATLAEQPDAPARGMDPGRDPRRPAFMLERHPRTVRAADGETWRSSAGVDFQKAATRPEIVRRAQYRGQVKRRMVQMQGAAHPGEEFGGGTVVDAAKASCWSWRRFELTTSITRLNASRSCARSLVNELFEKTKQQFGVHGRWMRRRDDPSTYMGGLRRRARRPGLRGIDAKREARSACPAASRFFTPVETPS